MIQAKCTQKFRDKQNKIIGYRLVDTQGQAIDFQPDPLKQLIVSGQIRVVNLTLTTDNRLVDATTATPAHQKKAAPVAKAAPNKQCVLTRDIIKHINKRVDLKFKSNVNLTAIAAKAKCAGLAIEKLNNDFVCVNNKDTTYLMAPGQIVIINGKELFMDTAFRSIDFTDVDTSKATDMSAMFQNCEVQSLNLLSFNTSKVTDMSRMFSCCAHMGLLDISNFDTSNVTDMSNMFEDCRVESLDLYNFNTSNVTNMSSMFFACCSLSLNVSRFNTSNVTDMENMFGQCTTEILDLSSFKTSKVTNMSWMFYECQARVLDIMQFTTSEDTDMDEMFYLVRNVYEHDVNVHTTDTRIIAAIRP